MHLPSDLSIAIGLAAASLHLAVATARLRLAVAAASHAAATLTATTLPSSTHAAVALSAAGLSAPILAATAMRSDVSLCRSGQGVALLDFCRVAVSASRRPRLFSMCRVLWPVAVHVDKLIGLLSFPRRCQPPLAGEQTAHSRVLLLVEHTGRARVLARL